MCFDTCFYQICFVALSPTDPKFFGFSEFLAGLALMVLVWTTTDIRYRFRIETAPIPLHRLTFWIVAIVGSLALVTDLWRAAGWLVPRGRVFSPETWQAFLGAGLLVTFLSWTWFAYLHPPRFGRRNAHRFVNFVYMTIVNGSSGEMATIGREIVRSIPSIIAATPTFNRKKGDQKEEVEKVPEWQRYAHDLILLIADPRFCRALVASSPGTIHAIFNQISTSNKFGVPIGQFSRNVMTAAIDNRESFLYHEKDGFSSGLIGYQKPLSQAIFGNYRMVEEINMLFDVEYTNIRRWSATEWEAYINCLKIVIENYIKENHWQHSFTIYRALNRVGDAASDIYKFDGSDDAGWESDSVQRLQVAVEFCKEILEKLDSVEPPSHLRLRYKDGARMHVGSIYDHLAHLMLKLILESEKIRGGPSFAWTVRYSIVWSSFLKPYGKSGSGSKIVRFKLRRLIFDEITRAQRHPNYLNIRLLSLCFDMMGFIVDDDSNFGCEQRALHKAILNWTRKNFIAIERQAPHLFAECFSGQITFDATGHRLVKTYSTNAFRAEPKRIYFALDEPAV